MKKHIIAIVLLNILLPLHAMQEQQVYPWYKAYKDPQLRQRITEGWQTTKKVAEERWQQIREFIKTHKKELAIIAIAVTGVALSVRAYNQVFKAYQRNNINLIEVRQKNKSLYAQLVAAGITAYSMQLYPASLQDAFSGEIYQNYGFDYNIESALKELMGRHFYK